MSEKEQTTRQKVRIGRVVSDKMHKTVVVAVEWRRSHPLYKKLMRRITKFKAHDEGNTCQTGDVVRIQETRPLSKSKHWRVVEILQHHEIPEVSPSKAASEIERAVQAEAKQPPQETPVAEPLAVVQTDDVEDKPAAHVRKKSAVKKEEALQETPVAEPLPVVQTDEVEDKPAAHVRKKSAVKKEEALQETSQEPEEQPS
jgi:small subunit ribosomal protein S17